MNNERKKLYRGIHRKWAILLACVLLLSAVTSTGVTYGSNLSDAQKELEDVQSQIKNLQSEIKNSKSEADSLGKKMDTLDASIATAEKAVANLNQDITDARALVAEAEAKKAEKEAEVAEQDRAMGLRIRNMYKNGDVGLLEILLGSESIVDLMTNLDMAQRIFQSDEELLEDLQDQYNELEAYRRAVTEAEQNLEEKKATQLAKQAELEASRKEVAQMKTELVAYYTQLEAKEDALTDIANDLTKEILELQGTEAYVGGDLIWPMPASVRITSNFGYRNHPILKVWKLHTGIDIGVSTGNSVLAANAGKVIKTQQIKTGYGYMVMVDHGGGIVTLYAHLSKILVKVGDVVTQGQIIAKSGNTGDSTGPHLHFEVRVDGVYKDPLNYVTPKKN